MEALRSLNLETRLVFAWLALVLCGPYFPIHGLPLRLDHVLFPSAGVLVLGWLLWKQKSFCVSSKPLLLFGAFLGLASFSTILALRSPEFQLNTVALLADLESHLRIALILWLCAALGRRHEVSVPLLLKALFWVCVLLAFFGVLQVFNHSDLITPFYKTVKKFSVDWFTGRHSKGAGLVRECVGWRAVSVFYHPGNCALFCILTGSVFFLSKNRLGLSPVSYWVGLFVIWWCAGATLSKGFLGGVFFLGFYLLFRRRWVRCAQFCVLIALAFCATLLMSEHASRTYSLYFQRLTLTGLYNQFLGARFGRVDHAKAVHAVETTRFALAPVSKTPEPPKKIVWGRGYLSQSLDVIKRHPWLGVGYSSNVSAGDSMAVHLLVRGGILGTLLFTLFLAWMALEVWRKRNPEDPEDSWARESWILCAVFFYVFGIAFPTFVQDRTGDLFWWIGGLLCASSRGLRNP